MMNQLNSYYRLPEPWITFACRGELSLRPGFFSVGDGLTVFGRCAEARPESSYTRPLPNVLSFAKVEARRVDLPFDLDEVIRIFQWEEYTCKPPLMNRVTREIYYHIRPVLSVRIRKYLQRAYLSGWKHIDFPHWPIDRSADRLMERALALGIRASGKAYVPFIWFWPEGHGSCAIVTHDVETSAGRDFCSRLMDLDDSCSMKSAFQVIPEKRYELSPEFLNSFQNRGFELNVHDLDHDGMLFSNEKTFMERVSSVNRYGRQFGARGFRSGVMYRNQRWLHALDFEYDMSVPAAAHLEPQRGGCCTVMPYFVGNVLELPLTTTQDYTLFHVLNERSIEIWQEQIELLQRNHGLITILVHPDYIIADWAQKLYLELLQHLVNRASTEKIWITTPGQVNDWWRYRRNLSLQQEGETWKLVGDHRQRARIAYATVDGDSVKYSFSPPTASDKTLASTHHRQ